MKIKSDISKLFSFLTDKFIFIKVKLSVSLKLNLLFVNIKH